jgi:hypothetical protein
MPLAAVVHRGLVRRMPVEVAVGMGCEAVHRHRHVKDQAPPFIRAHAGTL